MTTRQLRLLRAATASSVATLLAAVSHTLAGGMAPHPLLIVAVAVLLTPIAAALIGVKLSKVRTALTVMIGQAAFHLVFQLLGAPTAGGTALGHHHDAPMLGDVSIAVLPDAPMLAGHVIAAVITTALLWHGESMVRAIAGWMLARLLPASAMPQVESRPLPAPASPLFPAVDAAHAVAVSRRGPPRTV